MRHHAITATRTTGFFDGMGNWSQHDPGDPLMDAISENALKQKTPSTLPGMHLEHFYHPFADGLQKPCHTTWGHPATRPRERIS